MASGLERFDEITAELNDLPSPYYLRKAETDRLIVEQLMDKTKGDVFEALQISLEQIRAMGFQPNTIILHPQLAADLGTIGVGPK